MQAIGSDIVMLDGVPRNLAGSRRELEELGLRLVDVTQANRHLIAEMLSANGYGARHRFWVESWDGVRNDPGGTTFVVAVNQHDPHQLDCVPASPSYPYRHLAQRGG
ncbi:hypothetical protein SAMN06265360_11936 [Haloechinothrix alba]|uniref:Uncharacterized protein n=1 Tax=Haloechinothrix alba TaxID=664784 RepID=A0A238Z4L5_9PSEU|nr:hypothetical protein [Haloechinothrix alba]SNR78317.1 hypothetical protein SAMN06265360_11936 [Haloechinothrix alba]